MNNKGFTVVELIAAFSVTMIISVFLFELLIEVKDIFIETSLKTNIEEKTAIISKNIYNMFQEKDNSITSYDNKRCTVNGNEIKFVENYIYIGNQKFTMPKDGNKTIKIENPSIINFPINSTDGYIKISFNLTSDNLAKPYEYNVVFYYN